MLQFSQFVWAQRSTVWDVFNNFLLIDTTDRSKISSDQKRFFIALSLYPLSFFANTPFKVREIGLNLDFFPRPNIQFETFAFKQFYNEYCTIVQSAFCNWQVAIYLQNRV